MSLDLDFNEADTFGLRFESHDDALDFARKSVEDGNRWLAVHKLDIAERYARGECEIRLICTARLKVAEYHFIFRAIPNGHGHRPFTNKAATHVDVTSEHGDGANDFHVCWCYRVR